jgi:flagellar biosynthetic protein FliO
VSVFIGSSSQWQAAVVCCLFFLLLGLAAQSIAAAPVSDQVGLSDVAPEQQRPIPSGSDPHWTEQQRAERAGSQVEPPLDSLVKITLFLILVLALILALAWFVQKTGVGQRNGLGGWARPSGAPIEILSVQAVGVKEKLALVKVGEQCLLLGITAQSISRLAEVDAPDVPESAADTVAFADLLKRMVQR